MKYSEHYIILNGNLVPVEKSTWEVWIHGPNANLKLRESHLVCHGKTWARVVTYFTGCDRSPGSDKPYLWESRVCDGAPFMIWRYVSEEQARNDHDRYVRLAKNAIETSGIELEIVNIKQEVTQEP